MDYNEIAQDALTSIQEAGRSFSITRSTGTFNPATNVITGPAPITYNIPGVMTSFANRDIDGEVIRLQDRKILLAAAGLPIVPNTSDKVTDGSDVWNIINVEEIRPASIPILYKIHVRK